ncbi:MAG: YbjN domain-containing protein [Acidobacteria bacterium]|nr:YbjN domain-containing protein [Acidobacteriota bacterium]MCW5967529.1 YbjN domain-containing protein [Blastocatellales bacterium]
MIKTRRSGAVAAVLAFALCVFAISAPGLAQDHKAAIARLLDQSEYSFTKASEGVWMIPFEGKELANFNVVATTQQDVLVFFVIVAEKKDFNATPAAMAKLLKLNHDLDRVKIGIDGDGDVFTRVDLSIRKLDVEELKVNVEQVAAAADAVYGAIKPDLKKTR